MIGRLFRYFSRRRSMFLFWAISSSSEFLIFFRIAVSSSTLTGFKIYSITFRRIACFAYSKSSKPEKMMILIEG